MSGTVGLLMSMLEGLVEMSYHSKSAPLRSNELGLALRWSMPVSQMSRLPPGGTGWSVPLPGMTYTAHTVKVSRRMSGV